MKMRIRILLFFLITTGFLVSYQTRKGENETFFSTVNRLKEDTSTFNRLIKADSFDLRILPPSSGVQFYRDGIVYLSSSKYEAKMIRNHVSFGKTDAYYAVLKDTILGNQKIFSPSVSFPYPCDAVTFSSDFNTMYFTMYSESQGVEKIYHAKFSYDNRNQGSWSYDENPVSFCSGQSSYTHPALSRNGKILIFASNRPGSFGGMDLYVTLEKEGAWSDPANLGELVNSKYNELYPYLDSENNLFFSTDNIRGSGGYDIYVCKFKNNTWEKPVNLSAPVNTRFDDVAFTINRQDGKTAFYTVKQNSGKRSIQLYEVRITNYRPDNLITLSQFFTRPEILKTGKRESVPVAQKAENEVKTIKQLIPELSVKQVDTVKKEIQKSETKQVVALKTEPVKPRIGESDSLKNIVVYRVQIISSKTKKGSTKVTVNSTDYYSFEYFYSGAYRTCIGEFSTLKPAIELQNTCRKYGFPQAFVVAFINNVRSTDPALFK